MEETKVRGAGGACLIDNQCGGVKWRARGGRESYAGGMVDAVVS